jgi:hypothetical protein
VNCVGYPVDYRGPATVRALRAFCAAQSADRYVAFVIVQGVPLVRAWNGVPSVMEWNAWPGGYWRDGRHDDWPRT